MRRVCARIAIIQKVAIRWRSYASIKIAGSTPAVFVKHAICATITVDFELMQQIKLEQLVRDHRQALMLKKQ